MNHAEPPPTDALLDAWRAWHDGGEEEREEAYRQAVRSARSGPALTAGEIVADRYRVEAHRSDGLLAATWEATDLVDDERVLLKTLHARFLHDEGSIDRFHQAIAHQAEHAERGIVPILATGEPWFGFHWAVTGFAPTVLTQVVADLDEIGARQVLLDVARSLEAAHLCGLSHGHVAPESIVLDARGSASLADFGLQPAMIDGPFAAPERADPDLPPSPPITGSVSGSMQGRNARTIGECLYIVSIRQFGNQTRCCSTCLLSGSSSHSSGLGARKRSKRPSRSGSDGVRP